MRCAFFLLPLAALAGCGRGDTSAERDGDVSMRDVSRALRDGLMPWRVVRTRTLSWGNDVHILRADPARDRRMLERAADRLCECSSDDCRRDARREYDLD